MLSKSQANLLSMALSESDFSTKEGGAGGAAGTSLEDPKEPGSGTLTSTKQPSTKGGGTLVSAKHSFSAYGGKGPSSELGMARRVKERAEMLGISNPSYYWIAEQSLPVSLQLEPPWEEAMSEEGDKFYYNSATEESLWGHPNLEPFRKMYEEATADATSKPPPANEAEAPIEVADARNSGRSSSSDSSSSSDDEDEEKFIDGKVAKELKEKFVEEDALYWRTQYDELLIEKNRLDRQLQRMEQVLQKTVGEQSKLHDEKYRLNTRNEDCIHQMTQVGDKAMLYLHKRGFHSSGKLRKHRAGDEDYVPTLESSVADMNTVVDLYIKVMQDNKSFDDAGYASNWEGAAKRVSSELGACFEYDEHGKHIETDNATLQFRLEELNQIVCSFGEYLQDNNARRDYTERMLEHVWKFAPGDTMVPLEFMTAIVDKNESAENDLDPKPVDLMNSYMNPPPSAVMKMKKELLEHRKITEALEIKLEKKEYELEALRTKLESANSRLDERRLFDENLNNKFDSLTKELNEMRLLQTLSGVPGNGESSNADSVDGKEINRNNAVALAKEMERLRIQVQDQNQELDISNKRAEESEGRTEKMFHELEESQRKFKAQEVNYQLTITKLRSRCQELREANSEQKQVAEGIYKELNKTLVLCASLEKDRNDIKMQLEMMKGGEVNIQRLKDALADENRRVLELERENSSIREEMKMTQAQVGKMVEKHSKAKDLMENIQVNLREKAHDAKRYLNMVDGMQSEKQQLIASLTTLRKNYMHVSDKLVEIQGAIRVFCRVRPLLRADIEYQQEVAPGMPYPSDVVLNAMIKYVDYNALEFDGGMYEFDRIFSPDDNQDEVFDEVEALVRGAIGGSNVCIFAYGQTGAGKTHTIIGPAGNKGVNMRAFDMIFKAAVEELEECGVRTDISVSMLEIYNERIIDLLVDDAGRATAVGRRTGADMNSLTIRTAKNGSVFVENLSEYSVGSSQEIASLLLMAGNNRHVSSTDPNEHSSRSHLIIRAKIQRYNPQTRQSTVGQLNIVDLAGSERVKMTGTSSHRLREAQHINKSLATLNDVITGLARHHQHIPYRNSALTHVLQDCLKPKSSKILLFVNISPLPMCKGDSALSLEFGVKCRNVRLGQAHKNVAYSDSFEGEDNAR